MTVRTGLAAAAAIVAAGPLAAAEIYAVDGVTVTLGIEAGAGGFSVSNPNFGLGRVDVISGENTGDAAWVEGYLEPSISVTFDAGEGFSLTGEVSAVLTGTGGDGDAGGFTDGPETDADIEKAWAGVTVALTDDEDNPWALTAAAGRMDMQIGDGFLFWDGNYDTGGDAAYWLAPRSAFDFAATVDVSNSAYGFMPFYVKGDGDQDHTEILGADLRMQGDWGSVGGLYAMVDDSDEQDFTRKGMEMISVRAHGVAAPFLDGLSFSGEYARQFGGEGATKFRADGYYAQADYAVETLPWTPTFSYRYSDFSGDGDDSDATVRAFDPLFYGFSGGWGTWFQGEIVGEYLLFNSNQRTHMAKVALSPREDLEIGAIYYHFDLDKKNYFGTPVGSRSFADEINVYADWSVTDTVYIGAVAGVAFPASGAKEAFGDNETIYLVQTSLIITY